MKDKEGSWASLPHEILSLILSYLLGGDITVFYAICRWWRLTPPPIKRLIPPLSLSSLHTEPPFLLLPSNNIFHPIYNTFQHKLVYEFPRAIIRASYCGWLLLTLSSRYIFFFNPLTKEKIELPDLDWKYQMCWPKLAFSTLPTSSNCLVFGVYADCNNMKKIYTIKTGQLNWTIYNIDSTEQFELSPSNPIFFKDSYYCLGMDGKLLIYDPMRNEAQLVVPPKSFLGKNQSTRSCHCYMVESKGKLMVVFMDREGHWLNVVSLNTENTKVWEKIDSLGDTMLFVSEVTSFSVKSVVKGTGNKIYFPRFVGDSNLFYSLTTSRYHCFDGSRSWKNLIETRWYPHSTWIKPTSLPN